MRKRVLSLVLAFTMANFITGCGGTETTAPQDDTVAVENTTAATEASVDTSTTESTDDMSITGMGDLYEYLGTISPDLPYVISPLAKDFINENPTLFPCADKETAEEYTDSSIEFKMINKNQNKYGDKLMCVSEAYVVGINESNYDDGTSLTEVQAMDYEGNYYYVLYIGVLDDIYQEDTIEIYGAPLGMTSFANVSGGTTISCVIAGSYVGKL